MLRYTFSLFIGLSFLNSPARCENAIEKQLIDIGSISNDEVVVVQRQYTTKRWRHEFTPFSLGGVPFGTVRRTLTAGASYTLHANDFIAWEAINFVYSKNFFSSFAADINASQASGSEISPDIQKLNFLLTTGFQITPLYGKTSTFSRWIAYVEPFISFGAGIAKTETSQYFTFFPGLGIRAFFREWFSAKLELRDYLYKESFIDRNSGNATSALRNNFAVMISLSFWLPKMPG